MIEPYLRKDDSGYKSPLESFLEETLEKYQGIELITIDFTLSSDKKYYHVIYKAHILKNDPNDIENSWEVNRSILYVQPDKDILKQSLFEDNIFSTSYLMNHPDSKLLFYFGD